MTSCEQLYQQRLSRYLTAMRNEKPDQIPIRPFVAEFTAKYAGMTCQDVVHDYNRAFEAARKCAAGYDWDAVVSNMVYVWTGLTQAIGLTYYGIPGIDVPAENGFQYREPEEEKSFMKADEYDELIDDPTAFLYNKWLPRVSDDISPMGTTTSYRNNLALVKGGMAMLNYFNAYGPHVEKLRFESGTVSAIAGIFKAPFDILGDKLRGYIGLTMDMITQPDKVRKACDALMPHLYNVALNSSDPNHQVPIGYWMHRGCIPFISKGEFESHYWPTVRPIIEELWKNGHQTLFYAEGNWDHHLQSFTELPDKSIVYHVDSGDIFKTNKIIGEKFCLSGGIPNTLLSFGKPAEIRFRCKRVIDEVARDGGYIMDASAIIQNDATIENMQILTDFTREYGVYSESPATLLEINDRNIPQPGTVFGPDYGMDNHMKSRVKPGLCIPWEEKRKEIPSITGNEPLVKQVWEDIDSFGNMFIWQCLLSF
ncbi:MAG: uroporphyrinogen decarboxylase family protein [Mariniphaga sp.]